MKNPLAGWKRFLTEPIIPALAWEVSRTAVAGIRCSKKDSRRDARKEKCVSSHALASLPAGAIAPSFERPNVTDPKALEKAIRDARLKLGADGGDAALLVPETCVRMFVQTFDGLPASPNEREELFRWRLAKLVPLKPADMRLGYDVIKSNGQAKVILALGAASVLGEYEAAFARAGFKIRTLSVPTLPLAALLPPQAADGGALIVNSEEDYISLAAVLGGEISLYRIKPFLADSGSPDAAERRLDLIVREIETTINFLEDKEKARIDALWVRPVAWPDGADAAADLRRFWPSLQVSEFPGPESLTLEERRVFAPLLGQVS